MIAGSMSDDIGTGTVGVSTQKIWGLALKSSPQIARVGKKYGVRAKETRGPSLAA